ncbi:MAG: endonuclease III domain-containing protein [Chloroflexi bacterium]|nr:endonuclease III domain-containing protein [Chloroflexota bacterium]
MKEPSRDNLLNIYHRLLRRYGPQYWWPAQEPFEVIIGAILTQSAAWVNVEKAIANLKKAKALDPVCLRQMPLEELAHLIYSCGYYNTKALKIKAFVKHLGEHYNDNLAKLLNKDRKVLRSELLSIHGIGEETADSIVLYAAGKPSFVVDAYTRRILHRLGISPDKDSYSAFQALFMQSLPKNTTLFNEYHALLVRHGKEVCRKLPLCEVCCLGPICATYVQSQIGRSCNNRGYKGIKSP